MILYHLGKANVVVDALSWKSMGSLAHIAKVKGPLVLELQELEASGIQFEITEMGSILAYVRSKSSLVERAKLAQGNDPKLSKPRDDAREGKAWGFSLDESNVLWFKNRLCTRGWLLEEGEYG